MKKKDSTNSKNIDKKKDYLEDLQRLQAEFENFAKRTEKEKLDLVRYSTEKLILKLLDVADNLETALEHNKDDGVKLIYSQLSSILEAEGVSKISSKGIFNPELHEVLLQEVGEVDDEIVEELQSGYKLGEKVIRPAKVKVSKVGKNE